MTNNLRVARCRAWAVWAVATTLAVCLAIFGFRDEYADEGMLELGLIFAGYVVAMGAIAGRAKDVSTLLTVAWGGTMGFWCHRWSDLCTHAVHAFLPKIGLASPVALEAMELPATIAATGAVSAALLLVATRSAKVSWACLAVSLAAAAVPLMDGDAKVLPWAAAGWHMLTAAALAVWAGEASTRRSGRRCHTCGADVQGLSSPVCLRCATPLRAGSATAATVALLTSKRPI